MRLTIPIPRPVRRATMLPALEALSQLNEELLEAHAQETGDEPTPLYASGVRYQAEPPGQEDWDTVAQVYPRGHGDCEDLAGIRCAELRRAGDTSARADTYRSRVRPDGSAVWHAVVVRGDGTLEDPSALLGMRTHRGHAPEGVAWDAVMRGAMGQDAPERALLTAPELAAAFERLAPLAHRRLSILELLDFDRDWRAVMACADRPEACSRATRARLSDHLERWVRATTGLAPAAPASSMGQSAGAYGGRIRRASLERLFGRPPSSAHWLDVNPTATTAELSAALAQLVRNLGHEPATENAWRFYALDPQGLLWQVGPALYLHLAQLLAGLLPGATSSPVASSMGARRRKYRKRTLAELKRAQAAQRAAKRAWAEAAERKKRKKKDAPDVDDVDDDQEDEQQPAQAAPSPTEEDAIDAEENN